MITARDGRLLEDLDDRDLEALVVDDEARRERSRPAAASMGSSLPAARTASAPTQIVRASLIVIAALTLGLAGHVAVISGWQHRTAQVREFAAFRGRLAEGTAPVSGRRDPTHLLALGTPVALLEIPSLHVREVVAEGTTSGVLMSGPGHRRDTPLPGQAGTTVVYGRAAAFGGPFRDVHRLRAGDRIKVTTGQAVSTYKVTGRRHAGDKIAPLPRTQGRLSLVTASGGAYMPSAVLWVDAVLTSATLATPPAAVASGSIPKNELPLGTDSSTLWALVFWLQALVLISIGAVWSWLRWGHHQTWIVFAPLTLIAGLGASGQVVRLLPNLL